MAPIIDASWRRSSSSEQLELASKRAIVFAKTDELFVRRAESDAPSSSRSSTRTVDVDSKTTYYPSSSLKPTSSSDGREASTNTPTPSSSSSLSYASSTVSAVGSSSSSTTLFQSSTGSVSSTASSTLKSSSSSSSSSSPSSTIMAAPGNFAVVTQGIKASSSITATPSATPQNKVNTGGLLAVQAAQAARLNQNLGAVDVDPLTPTIQIQAVQTVVPFTTTDANGQTSVGSSTMMTTATAGANLATSDNGSKPNPGAIIGGAVGGLVAVLLIIACVFLSNRRSRKRREMEESTKPFPFTAQRNNFGVSGTSTTSLSRDVEDQRGGGTSSQPIRRGPSSAFAARFGADADRNPGGKPKARPPALPLAKDPFADHAAEGTYENVKLSPEDRHHPRGPHNPFADPVPLGRTSSVGNDQPKTPGSRGYAAKGLERVRGGAEVNRSASTRTMTNTPKIVGLPSRPKSAARGTFASES